MDDQELVRRITSLQARMNQMETLMQQLLSILTSSRADVERTMQMETMLQELRFGPVAATPQEGPVNRSIQEALLKGDKMTAIKLYRSLYGGSLKEAHDAIDAM